MRITFLHQRARRIGLGWALGVLVAAPGGLRAQETPTPPSAVVTWHDARLLGGFALAAGAVMPADRMLQTMMQHDWVQRSPIFQRGADVFNAYGSPGVVIGSVGLYAAGWAMGRPDMARLGMRSAEAIAISGVVTGALKGIAGRTRPFASPGNASQFHLMGGTHDATRQSFPSGHTTAAFAFAAALDQELRVSHPEQARWAGPALYGAAAATGLARMYSDKHWGSDVVLGAGIGLVSGLVVSRFHRDRPGHWLDRRFLPRAR